MMFTPTKKLIQSLSRSILVDDSSESSTFHVGFPMPPKVSRRADHSLVKRSVTFDESKNTLIETEYPTEELGIRWYTAYDVHCFRNLNALALKEMQRGVLLGEDEDDAPSVKAVLEHTYSACEGMLYEDIEVLCPIETAQLRAALRDPVFPVGLASYASSRIRRDCRARRRRAVEVVRLIQRTVQTSNEDDTVEYVRASVETISRPSRLFVQLIAEESV